MLGKDPDSLLHCKSPTSSTGINSSLNYSLKIFISTKKQILIPSSSAEGSRFTLSSLDCDLLVSSTPEKTSTLIEI